MNSPLDFNGITTVILNNEPEEEETKEEETEYSSVNLKQIIRRKLVFERRARGDTIEEIRTFLIEKGYSVSWMTVFRDLRSGEVVFLTDELIRVQFRDIALLRGFALQDGKAPNLEALAAAIRARGSMISCLKPKPEKSEVNVEVNVKQQTMIQQQTDNLLSKMSEDEFEAILHAEEILRRAETAAGTP